MRHSFILPALLTLVALTLAACTGEGTFPSATIEAVTPSAISTSGGEITIEGSNFFQYEGGERTRVEACGVSVSGEIVDAAAQTILLPPGGRVRVEEGSTLTVALPAEGLEPGMSDVRIVRPDGTETILEDAITCTDASVELAAVITASTTSGLAPLTVDFDAGDSTGEGSLTYAWEFGNGHTSTSASSEQTFSVAGTYTVTLTVTDESGESDTTSTTITVADSTPTARAAIRLEPHWPEGSDPAEPAPSYIVTFDGTGSTDPNGDTLTYAWTSEGQAVADGSIVEAPGYAPADATFVLTLTVTDPHGNSDSVTLHTLLDPYGDAAGPEIIDFPPFGSRLAPQRTPEEPAPASYPDVMRLTWYDAEDGGVTLELETVDQHPLLEPGEAITCGRPMRLTAQQTTAPALGAHVALSTDGDPETGTTISSSFPNAEYALLLLARNEDGTFPIIDPSVDGICDFTPRYNASVIQDGTLLTLHLPEDVIGTAGLLDTGIAVMPIRSLDDLHLPSDQAPDVEMVF